MMRWIPILALLLLPMILGGCASDSSVVYRSPSHFYYPNHSPYHYYDSDYFYGGWPMYQHTPRWRGYEIGPMPTKNIDDFSAEEKRRTVDTVNLINLYNSDPNRSWLWWDQRRIRVTPSP